MLVGKKHFSEGWWLEEFILTLKKHQSELERLCYAMFCPVAMSWKTNPSHSLHCPLQTLQMIKQILQRPPTPLLITCALSSLIISALLRDSGEPVAVETAARMLQGKRYAGQYGKKARARGLPVARGNKWSGREPGPLCRDAESSRVQPAQRLTKPTSIDRMKIEPTKHRAMVQRRTGTWPRARAHIHTKPRTRCAKANTNYNSF